MGSQAVIDGRNQQSSTLTIGMRAPRSAGALGGKLLGAGGGGFLLFFCEAHNQQRVREELSELRELTFSLDPEGSKIVHVGSERD